MMLFLLVAVVFGGGCDSCRHVEIIELNHVYDRCGGFRFSQVIYWSKERDDGLDRVRFVSRGYKIIYVDRDHCPEPVGVGFEFNDIEGGKTRRVRSKFFRETVTQEDVEALDRNEQTRRGVYFTIFEKDRPILEEP